MQNNAQELVTAINKNYSQAKECVDGGRPAASAQYIRAALEGAVNLFWLKKLGRLPKFGLQQTIAEYEFRKNFFELSVREMQGLREKTANVLGKIVNLSDEEAADMLSRLKNCIELIGQKLGIELPDKYCESAPVAPVAEAHEEEEKSMTETEKFWEAFKECLMWEGEPFPITVDREKGVIYKNYYGSLEVTFQPFKQSFKIGIYTSNKAAWNNLNAHKAEIIEQLEAKPIWGASGTSYYIESQMASSFFDNRPYEDIIEESIEDIAQYAQTFADYMTKIDISAPSILTKPLIANLKRGFGGNAKEIYLDGCKRFGWREEYSNRFSMMQILYSTNATPEDYSVWCLCKIAQLTDNDSHIDWYEVDRIHDSGKNWANILFAPNGKKIYEIWKNIGPDFPDYKNDMSTRLTFIKCKYTNSEYAFGGIYQPIKLEDRVINGKVYHIKVYERIEDTYGK